MNAPTPKTVADAKKDHKLTIKGDNILCSCGKRYRNLDAAETHGKLEKPAPKKPFKRPEHLMDRPFRDDRLFELKKQLEPKRPAKRVQKGRKK